jgi:hypothetical protein
MTNQMIRIHNTETDEVIDREMNADELKQHNKDLADQAKAVTDFEAKEANKAALLAKLGISADEAALLLA